MSPAILTYFDFAGGRGEAARIALHLSGTDWTDNRIQGNWPELKPTTPFGGLPTLEIPDKGTLSQCNAILAYLGRAHGLLPSDPFEAARHESVMNAIESMRSEAGTTTRDDEDDKRKAREAYVEGYFARWAGHMSAQIQGPFVGGDALSVADLKLYVALRSYTQGVFDYIPETVLAPYPKLTGLIEAVEAHAGVAEWLAKS